MKINTYRAKVYMLKREVNLKALSKETGIEYSYLSKVINSRVPLSEWACKKILTALDLRLEPERIIDFEDKKEERFYKKKFRRWEWPTIRERNSQSIS